MNLSKVEPLTSYGRGLIDSSSISTRTIQSIEEMQCLAGTWNDLMEQGADGNIFVSWEWLDSWCNHFVTGNNLRILVVEQGNGVKAILPLSVKKLGFGIGSFEILENIGSLSVDYGSILLGDLSESVTISAFKWLVQNINDGKIVKFNRVPRDSKSLSLLKIFINARPDGPLLIEEAEDVCTQISLTGDFVSYFSGLPKHFRKNLRRRQRALEKAYAVDFAASVTDDIDKDLRIFLSLYFKRWDNHHLRMAGHFSNSNGCQFAMNVIRKLNDEGKLWMSFMLLDGVPASVVLGFHHKNKWYRWKSAFDPMYAISGLGQIHSLHVIKKAFESGIEELDLLRGDQHHKSIWATGSQQLVTITLASSGFKGKCITKLVGALLRLRQKIDVELNARIRRKNTYTVSPYELPICPEIS